MTDLSKAIRTLQELPSNNPTHEELQAELEKLPVWARIVAGAEVTYQLEVRGAELSGWGYRNETLKAAKRLVETNEVLERHGYWILDRNRG